MWALSELTWWTPVSGRGAVMPGNLVDRERSGVQSPASPQPNLGGPMYRQGSSVLVTLAMLSVAACAPKEKAPAAADTTAAAAPAAAAPAAPATLTFHAADFKFEGPDSIPAGMVTFDLINDGATFHHMQIVRLDSAKTSANHQAAIPKPRPIPGWVTFIGGPNARDPHSKSNATMN